MMHRALTPLLTALLLPVLQTANADWSEIVALDRPVTRLSPDALKAKAELKTHFEAQIAANKAFLRENPGDPHAFDSQVRLAVAEARLGSLEKDPRVVDAAVSRMISLEKQAPDERQRAETMFRRISLQWQDLGNDPDRRRERAVTSALNFAGAFPDDRRAPRLLAEASTACDNQPGLKRRLVTQALGLPATSADPSLKRRLEDDIRRLDLLGKPVNLSFRAIDGSVVDLSRDRGKVVAIVFWAADSAPCLVWMRDFVTYAAGIPDLKVVGISLDRDRGDLEAAVRTLKINWPMAFDGRAWEGHIVREFGINALPTLWLIGGQGNLETLNARDNYQLKIRELLLRK
jgi:hypothetical protein